MYYKFKVKREVSVDLEIELTKNQFNDLIQNSNVLIDIFLKEYGEVEFISAIKPNSEHYTVLEYNNIKSPIDETHKLLVKLWKTWCRVNTIDDISADDLFLLDLNREFILTEKQHEFVENYIKLWGAYND